MNAKCIHRLPATAFALAVLPLVSSAQNHSTAPPTPGSAGHGEKAVLYSVPGTVAKLKQPDGMACWATAATILLEWRLQRQFGSRIKLEIADTVRMADKNRTDQVSNERRFTYLLENKCGLSDVDKPAFLKALGFLAEWPANYTVQGWKSLLKDYGPLWVTTEIAEDGQSFIHAEILTGLTGGGSYADTGVIFVDPLDGKEHREDLVKFVHRYEAVVIDDTRIDAQSSPRLQVLHLDKEP